MEFFRNTNIDFLGKKWYFLTFSLIFSVAGVLSMAFWHGIPLGVDFRGGTLVYVKYSHTPDTAGIHAEIDRAGLKNARVQAYDKAHNSNEVLIQLDIQETSEQALDKGKIQIIQALESHAPAGKQDLNNSSSLTILNYLLEKDPLFLGAGTDANPRYTAIAQAIVDYRDKVKSGVLGSIDELKSVADPAVVASLPDNFYVSDFGIRNVEIVGPQVGAQLRSRAIAGHALFAGRDADLPGLALRMDLRGGGGIDGVPRHFDHGGRVLAAELGNIADRDCGHSDLDWILE